MYNFSWISVFKCSTYLNFMKFIQDDLEIMGACGLLVILHCLVVRCVENVQSRRRVSKISRYENCERREDYWRETE